MLEERAVQIRVGIFVTAGCVLAGIIIFMLGSERAWFQRKYEVRARFADTSGLVVGAPVELAGFKIGAVAAITLPASLATKEMEVVMKVARTFQERIRADSTVMINTQGLLGDKFLTISVGSPTETIVPPGAYLRTKPSAGFASLAERGTAILDKLDSAVGSIQTFIDDRSEASLAHTLFYDPRGKELMTDLSRSMQSLKKLTDRFDAQGTAGILANLQRAAADLQAVTAQVRRGEGTVGGLLTDPAIYNDLRSLFGRANRNVLLKTIVRSTLRENERKTVEP